MPFLNDGEHMDRRAGYADALFDRLLLEKTEPAKTEPKS